MYDESYDTLLAFALTTLADRWWEPQVGLVAAALLLPEGASYAATSYMAATGRYYHAEHQAVETAKANGSRTLSNAAMAVTLSPCTKGMATSRIGPPCVQLLKNSGIFRVHTGVVDPLFSNEGEYANVGIKLTVTQNPRLVRACSSLLAVFTQFGRRVNTDIVGVKRELGTDFAAGLI
jgi:pyrimidine deaminase RibD-like protein